MMRLFDILIYMMNDYHPSLEHRRYFLFFLEYQHLLIHPNVYIRVIHQHISIYIYWKLIEHDHNEYARNVF